MKLITRLDGKCDRCRSPFMDEAFTVKLSSTKIVRYVGDKPDEIKEENISNKTLCYVCYDQVKALFTERYM